MENPAIILVRPQMGENIGAAARAMANFGLTDLRLVAPRDGWPNPKASDTAGKALDVIDDATIFEHARDAVADCKFVLATTARSRAANLQVYDVRDAMKAMRARGERCAILFGPERTGLENEEISLADAVVTIPVSEHYTSLNLGQAVVVAAYEWMMSSGVTSAAWDMQTATREELFGLFDQLEQQLEDVNFWRVPEKKEIMWRNIRATLMRAGMSGPEVATWRGIIRALKEG